jgi:molybdenum cofactor cytidylyltransferase
MTIAAVLLAAGRSTRFGAADKLQASLGGIPLALHAARTLAKLPFAARFVVTAGATLDWPDFLPIVNDRPEAGMARSLALGVAAARAAGAEAVLVALADMPFVPVAHFARLTALHRGPPSLAASSDGETRLPPALFGADWFAVLEALSGDKGARALLDRAEPVVAPADWLVDIDSVADLASAQCVREGTTGG